MAERLGEALLELSTVDKGYAKGVDQAEQRAVRFGQTLDRVGERARKVGGALSLAVTAPLALFARQAAQAATDAEELQSAFDFSFGAMAGQMNAWAVRTGDALGRSTQALQQAAFAFNQLFKDAAPTGEQAAELSRQFAVLAQDLASFYNIAESDALAKLRSGLVGEAEPLRDLGVFLSAAAVEAKALEMGLADASGAVSAQAAVLARAALIMEQTGAAQGDLARTSESAANRQRALAAAWDELSVAVGTQLLPALTPLVEMLTDAVNWFSQLDPATQKVIVIAGGLAAAIGPVIAGIGLIAAGIGPVVAGFGLMASGIAALLPVIAGFASALMALVVASGPLGLLAAAIAGIVLIWANWDTIGPILQRLYEAAKAWLMDKLGAVLGWVGEQVEAVKGYFADLYDAVVGHSFVPDLVDGIEDEFGRLGEVMVKPAEQAAGQVEEAFGTVADEVGGLLDKLVKDGKLGLDDLRSAAASVIKALGSMAFERATKSLPTTGFGGFLGDILGAFAGGFAAGGIIPAGQWGIVGERGPEPVFAGRHGLTVLPARAAGGAAAGPGAVNVTVNIATPDPGAFRASQGQIMTSLARAVGRGQRGL